VSWSRRFEEPIELPDEKKTKDPRRSYGVAAKEFRVRAQDAEGPTAALCVTRAAEHGRPMIFAQMAILQRFIGIIRGLQFRRQDTHWGKRKLKRDQ